jgi:hypothetical protein
VCVSIPLAGIIALALVNWRTSTRQQLMDSM